MKRILILSLIFLLALPVVSAYNIGYPWAGTYNWTAPAGNTSMFVNLAGGGGSGASSGTGVIFLTWGYGGSAGEYGNTTMVPVTPGSNYTLVVGAGGATATPSITGTHSPAISHAGGDSSAFGITKHGGAGGVQGSETASVGGVGASTNYLDLVIPATSGGTSGTYAGGAGGYGYGAAGGGAGGNLSTGDISWAGYTTGGAGRDGYVGIWDMNASGGNTAAYTASPTTTGYGSVVTFIDESILLDGIGLVYDWDFGDGSTHGTTKGSTSHVYSTYGVFTTNLTLTSSLGTTYLNKSNYITVTNVPITAWQPAKVVKFKIVDAYGADLPGSNVSVQYMTNSLPSKDPSYLVSAFGIPQSIASQMVTGAVAMFGSTGDDGTLSFLMYPSVQYGISITNTTIGLSKYLELYPSDTDYLIRCPLTSQTATSNTVTAMTNTSLYVTEPNASYITWNLHYQDGEGYTTALEWNVTCWNNMTVMHSNSWGALGPTSIVLDNYTFPSTPVGMEYRALLNATRVIP